MTANRRADLQRKLAMVPVPKPPDGLADRIKSDIPKELMLDADKERRRLRQSVAFNIRVAASIILLVSSVYLALNLLSRRFGPLEMASKSNVATDTVAAAAPQAPVTQLAKAHDLPAEQPRLLPATAKTAAVRRDDRKEVIVAEARPEPLALHDAAKENEEIARDRIEVAAPAPPPPPPPAARAAGAFAYNPALEVEIAAAPFDAAKHVVRVSGGDEKPKVTFNDEAVAAWRAVSDDLYEVMLRPGGSDAIAFVQAGDLTRTIRRGDLRSWNDASRRTKSAALAAALAAGVAPAEVAAKARAAGLDDLAAAAEAKRQKP